ncbi:nociceptin receptor-like [Ylistrum balloti]|uniref:nociceptin receptor-like n=1 Tax=Ylistrum balloti TaxID=509963 RepID=UPI002905B1E7|nr:nociceptin receptor-like [Ylistrum balloti]
MAAINATVPEASYSVLGNATVLSDGLLNTTAFDYVCLDAPDEYAVFYEWAQFVTGLIIYPIVCMVGIIGNTLTLIVLGHKDMRTATNVYLSSLAVSDTIKLLNDLMYFVLVVLKVENLDDDNKIIFNFYPYAHYIFNMSVCVTAWLTVSVAVDRYIAVCHITKAKEMCTIARARIVSTVVFVSMITLSVPSALRYKPMLQHDDRLNVSCYKIQQSTLGENDQFMTPYTWVQNSLRSIIPLIVLIFLNARIINELRKQRVPGKKLSSRNRITLMLIVIILCFVVCIMPDAVMSLFFGFGYVDETNLVRGIREITDSLLAVNSALNFLLYCIMSKVFRTTFIKIFCKSSTVQRKVSERVLQNGHSGCAVSVARKDSNSCSGNNNKDSLETYV